jgi:hypothetical protein
MVAPSRVDAIGNDWGRLALQRWAQRIVTTEIPKLEVVMQTEITQFLISKAVSRRPHTSTRPCLRGPACGIRGAEQRSMGKVDGGSAHRASARAESGPFRRERGGDTPARPQLGGAVEQLESEDWLAFEHGHEAALYLSPQDFRLVAWLPWRRRQNRTHVMAPTRRMSSMHTGVVLACDRDGGLELVGRCSKENYVMAKTARLDPKRDALRKSNALHPHPE